MRVSGATLRFQRVYRALLRATANPGELVELPNTGVEAYESVLETLLDHEVTFAAVGEGASEMQRKLSLGTGARVVLLREADFALALGGDLRGGLLKLKRGTLEDPADGATAVYSVERLTVRGPLTLSLSGPGVPEGRTVGVEGLAEGEVDGILEARVGYPMGVDVYLADREGTVVGLPRSTRVEEVISSSPTRP